MAFAINKIRIKRYSKNYQDSQQYNIQKCIFSVVPHFDIPRFVLLHSMSSNWSERRSISLGLKNIMIYVITFLIMTGKKCKTSCKYKKNSKRYNLIKIVMSLHLYEQNFQLIWYFHEISISICYT